MLSARGRKLPPPSVIPPVVSKTKVKEEDEAKLMNNIRASKVIWKLTRADPNNPVYINDFNAAWTHVAAKCGKPEEFCKQEFYKIKLKINYRITKFTNELNEIDGKGPIRTWEEIAKIARDVPAPKQTWPLWYSIEWFSKEYYESQLATRGIELNRPEQVNVPNVNLNAETINTNDCTPGTSTTDEALRNVPGNSGSSVNRFGKGLKKISNKSISKKKTPLSNFHVSSGATTDHKTQTPTMMEVKREKEDEGYTEEYRRYNDNGPPLEDLRSGTGSLFTNSDYSHEKGSANQGWPSQSNNTHDYQQDEDVVRKMLKFQLETMYITNLGGVSADTARLFFEDAQTKFDLLRNASSW